MGLRNNSESNSFIVLAILCGSSRESYRRELLLLAARLAVVVTYAQRNSQQVRDQTTTGAKGKRFPGDFKLRDYVSVARGITRQLSTSARGISKNISENFSMVLLLMLVPRGSSITCTVPR